jgi:hypothetical protein
MGRSGNHVLWALTIERGNGPSKQIVGPPSEATVESARRRTSNCLEGWRKGRRSGADRVLPSLGRPPRSIPRRRPSRADDRAHRHGHGWNGSMGAASKPLPPFRHDRRASLEKRWRPILSGATAQLWEADCLTVSRLAGFGRDRTWGLGFPRLRYREGERAVFNQR